MAIPNRISTEITSEVKEEVLRRISEARTLLPFLIALSDDERKALRDIGQQGLIYTLDTLDGMNQFPETIPATFDKNEFTKDVVLLDSLDDLMDEVMSFYVALKDTYNQAGSEAMKSADKAYDYLKKGEDNNVSLREVVAKIGKRFEGQGKKKPPVNPN